MSSNETKEKNVYLCVRNSTGTMPRGKFVATSPRTEEERFEISNQLYTQRNEKNKNRVQMQQG